MKVPLIKGYDDNENKNQKFKKIESGKKMMNVQRFTGWVIHQWEQFWRTKSKSCKVKILIQEKTGRVLKNLTMKSVAQTFCLDVS